MVWWGGGGGGGGKINVCRGRGEESYQWECTLRRCIFLHCFESWGNYTHSVLLSSFFPTLLLSNSSPPCSDYLFKLLLVGDTGVGKSSLLSRFAVCHFSPPPLPFSLSLSLSLSLDLCSFLSLLYCISYD